MLRIIVHSPNQDRVINFLAKLAKPAKKSHILGF